MNVVDGAIRQSVPFHFIRRYEIFVAYSNESKTSRDRIRILLKRTVDFKTLRIHLLREKCGVMES